LKSWRNKTTWILVPALASCLIGATVNAGVAKSTQAEQVEAIGERKRLPSNEELPTSMRRSQRNQSQSILRCWQNGQLIFDERNWRTRGGGAPGLDLYSNDGRFRGLRLMQFGETFCALQHGGR